MSAIWGCVDLSGRALPEGLGGAMEQPLRDYRIERFAAVSDTNAVMGCGMQHIKTWSARDPLPIRDGDVLFTADCLIDNRAGLTALLCPGTDDVPDGELLYLAWREWGAELPKRVYGSYSFAAYRRGENSLVIGADHVASRSVYYLREGSRVFFGTLEESILRGKSGRPELNEEWIALFLAMKPISILTNPEDTVYKGIFRVAAGCVNVFSPEGKPGIREYWSPKQVKPLRLGSDSEYKEHFRELFFRCARETVQGVSGETGVLLSCGLDSASVAAAVAPLLAEKGKKLLAYTHVPVEGFVSPYNPRRLNADEREGVLKLCGVYPNIEPHFLPLPERDGFSNIREILAAEETPYKSLVNLDWIFGLESAARADGCRMMLTGQVGNSTISWGDMMVYLRSLITRGRPFHAFSTMSNYSRVMGWGRKRVLLHFLSRILPDFSAGRGTDWLEGSFVNRGLAGGFGIGAGDERIRVNLSSQRPPILPYGKLRMRAFNKTAFAHVADSTTKLSLKNGQVSRDITADIRIYEFCFASPIECSVNDSPATRRLVRSYLAEDLPPEMIAETWPRGRQSADWRERIQPNWQRIYGDIQKVCRSKALSRFAEPALIEEALERWSACPAPEDEYEFMRFGAVYLLGLFLEKNGYA